MNAYVVTFNPSDFPGKYVVRRHEFVSALEPMVPKEAVAIAGDIKTARGAVPTGCLCFEPDPADDPVIVEYWV